MARGYAELLRARHAVRLITATLAGRLPNATATLAVVLFTRAHQGGYALAGVLSAVYGLGVAAGQPALGRLVDKHGQPRVMLGGALVSAAATAAASSRWARASPAESASARAATAASSRA